MRSLLHFAPLLLVGWVASGCGSGAGSAVSGTSNTSGNGGNGGSSGNVASGAVSGSLALDPGKTPDPDIGSNPVVTPDAACATGTASTALAGVNIIVMFDRSTSMNQSANQGGATRWALTSAALTAFFQSTEAAGLKLALRFFPHDLPVPGCNEDGCDAAACGSPLVEVGALTAERAPMDQQEMALVNATMMSAPVVHSQGTPIYAALDGALQWARTQRQTTPNESSVVILVTDGQANGCEESTEAIAGLAAGALASDNVRTYAIGLTGSLDAEINAIAKAGGTTQGIFVADGADTQQELLKALAAIRGQVLDCDIPLPQPKAGQSVYPTKVNVNVTNNGTQTTLSQVADAAGCAAMPGWYYDNASSPTRIILCQASCDAASIDVRATLDILLGCETVTDVPR
jgi:hypothetical protein